jgi:isopentenyl phosphate kinase
MTTVLKLGGSVITDKETPETVDEAALDRTATAVGDALAEGGGVDDLILVHGAGSFGHHYADKHGVSTTDGTHDAVAVREVHGSMAELTDSVLDALGAADVPAVPVRPLSAAHRSRDGALSLPSGQVETLLGEGFVPVLHGDIIAHTGHGATILSGDEIVVTLARSLGAERVGLCSTVPGVLDDDGDVIPEISVFDDVASALGESDATDVTGGMAGKVRTLLDLPIPATIFAPGDLSAFLDGDSPGTVIDGQETEP